MSFKKSSILLIMIIVMNGCDALKVENNSIDGEPITFKLLAKQIEMNSDHVDMVDGPPIYFNSVIVEVLEPLNWIGTEMYLKFNNTDPIHNNQKIKIDDVFLYETVISNNFKYRLKWLNE